MAELELSLLEPPYTEAFPPTRREPALGSVAIGRIGSARGLDPTLAQLLERAPWVIPFVVVAPLYLSPSVLQAMWGLPSQPAFLVTSRPTERTPTESVIKAIAGRPAPPNSLLIAYVVRRTRSVVLGETLAQIWDGRRGHPNADRTVRYRFRKFGAFGRHDWNRIRLLIEAKTEGSGCSVEQLAQSLDTDPRTFRGWIRRYLVASSKTFLATAGWEWIMETALRRGGFRLEGVDLPPTVRVENQPRLTLTA